MTDPLFEDFRSYIGEDAGDVRAAYDRFLSDPAFTLVPRRSAMRSVAFTRPGGPKGGYYSFIVNRGWLLFYIRRPALCEAWTGQRSALSARFDERFRENPAGEWTFQVWTVEDVRSLEALSNGTPYPLRSPAPEPHSIEDLYALAVANSRALAASHELALDNNKALVVLQELAVANAEALEALGKAIATQGKALSVLDKKIDLPVQLDYEAAKPHLDKAWTAAKAMGNSINEFIDAIVELLGAVMDEAAALNLLAEWTERSDIFEEDGETQPGVPPTARPDAAPESGRDGTDGGGAVPGGAVEEGQPGRGGAQRPGAAVARQFDG